LSDVFLDACEDDAIGPFHRVVGLWVVDRGEAQVGAKLSGKLPESCTVELLAIVHCNLLRDPEAADDVLPKEFLQGSCCDVPERFGLHPFGEVLYRHNGVLVVSWSCKQW